MAEIYADKQVETNKRTLMTGSLAHFIQDGFTDMLYVFFPVWQAEFSLTFSQIGFLKTLFSGTMAGFQVPASSFAVRIGAYKLLLIGIVLTSVAVTLLGYAATPIVLGFFLIIGGLGASVQHPISSSLISNAYPDVNARRTALSTFNVAGDIGKLILPGTAAFLMVQYSWMTVSHMLGVVGIGVAILIFFNQQESKQAEQSTENKQDKAKMSSLKWKGYEAFWSLSTIGVIDSGTRMGFLTFLPFLLQDKGADMATIGLVLSLIFAGGAVGKFVCGILATKIGVLRSVIATELMTTLCIFGMIMFPLHTAVLVSPLIGIALNGTSSVLYGSVPELVSEEQRQKAFAIFYTLTIGSGAISPSIYGVVSDGVGIQNAVVIVALVVLFTIPLTVPLRKRLMFRG
ncbi:MAG: major facilitator superfamily 1 [Firmicutes bacterium]|nr:major facilitator superfamily 1 [Bacillota bacterium]